MCWLTQKPLPHDPSTPRPYQQDAIAGILQTFDGHDRATAVMACGTGKTLVALWVAERLNPKTVLVLLPSLILVQQTLDEWSKHNNWGKRFSYMCVCSDRTVAGNDDTVQLSTIDMTFRVDTDPEHVRKFLERPTDHVRVVFSTYQSSKVVGDAAEVVRGHI